MDDLKYHFEMNSDGKPVLQNIRRAGDETMTELARLTDSGVSTLAARIMPIDPAILLAVRPAHWPR